MSGRYLLDTNAVSVAVSRRSDALLQRLQSTAFEQLFVSAISYGEIEYGLARRPEATRLRDATRKFFGGIEVLSWTKKSADAYASLRADMEGTGKSLSALDMLIAAHCLEIDATLVSADRAFRFVPGLTVEDWLAD
jgi:tRNA(fMet)-specific endonuclease VapC